MHCTADSCIEWAWQRFLRSSFAGGREVRLVHPPVSGCGVWPAFPFGRGCGVWLAVRCGAWLARLPVEDDGVWSVRIPLNASGV